MENRTEGKDLRFGKFSLAGVAVMDGAYELLPLRHQNLEDILGDVQPSNDSEEPSWIPRGGLLCLRGRIQAVAQIDFCL